MIHKFKDYNNKEQREIVFEIIKQKYLSNYSLNNFGNNCTLIINLIRSFETDKISEEELKTKLEEFYSKNRKEISDEVLFYFYNIAEKSAETMEPSRSRKYKIVSKIIQNIIDVEAIGNTIKVPEDKIGDIDRGSNNGFTMISYSKYPTPSSYVATPPPPPVHNFQNPYKSKDFKSICDYLRYTLFDMIIEERLETLEDLENLSVVSLIPDSDNVINFPQWEDEDGEKEDLDFENPGDFVINDENSITFGGGGDWQEPKTFSLELITSGKNKGKFKAFDIEDGYSDNDYGAKAVLKVICKLFNLNRKKYNLESTNPNELKTLYDDMVNNKDFKLSSTKVITTEDCIQAIIDYFPNESADFRNPKNWKRKSKTGSGYFIRIFENKVTKDRVEIGSFKTSIDRINKI